MFKVEDIVARLQNGEDANAIAAEMCNALNEAITVQKEAEEKAAKADREAEKMTDLQVILDLIHDFCMDYYCESDEDEKIINEAFAGLDAKTVNEMIENAGRYAADIMDAEKHIHELLAASPFFAEECKPAIKAKHKPKTVDPDATIKNFLKSIGL